MDLKVVSGKTIQLPAEFFEGVEPAEPASPRVTIVDPAGVKVVTNGVPLRTSKGVYRYNYTVPASGPTGTWEAVWTATIGRSRVSASDKFQVQPAPAVVPPEPVEALKPPAAKPFDTPKAPVAAKPVGKSKAEGSPKQADKGKIAESTKASETPDARAEKPSRSLKNAAAGPDGAANTRPRRSLPTARTTGTAKDSEPRPKLSRGKALLILGAIAIIVIDIWFSPRRNDTLQAKIEEGVAAQKAGRTDEAQRLYEEVLSNDPNNKLANFNLGVAAQIAGDMERAESLYEKSLDADPKFLPALFNLAILQERTDRNEESAETYRRLLEEYPDNGPAHLNYGFLLVQKLNKPDEGREEFKLAVEKDPNLARRIPIDMRPGPAAP
ncbi:hypothetical protein BH23ACT12_BH23ACT12_06780 [soil metagenome]